MFRVASTVDAASSGNEVLLLKDNGNDRFTWITQFYVTVVDADGTRTHALPARQRCSVRPESRAWTPRQRSRLPSEGPSKIPTEINGDTQLGQHAAHAQSRPSVTKIYNRRQLLLLDEPITASDIKEAVMRQDDRHWTRIILRPEPSP